MIDARPDRPSRPFTRREREVVDGIRRGLTYERIRLELGMGSIATVRSHAKAAAMKLEARAGVPAKARLHFWANSADGRTCLALSPHPPGSRVA